MRQLTRYHSEVANARGERLLIETRSLNENPREEHGRQDGVGHPWRPDGRKLVAKGNHVAEKLWDREIVGQI
jgi:hypothetical protein